MINTTRKICQHVGFLWLKISVPQERLTQRTSKPDPTPRGRVWCGNHRRRVHSRTPQRTIFGGATRGFSLLKHPRSHWRIFFVCVRKRMQSSCMLSKASFSSTSSMREDEIVTVERSARPPHRTPAGGEVKSSRPETTGGVRWKREEGSKRKSANSSRRGGGRYLKGPELRERDHTVRYVALLHGSGLHKSYSHLHCPVVVELWWIRGRWHRLPPRYGQDTIRMHQHRTYAVQTRAAAKYPGTLCAR